MERGGEPGDAVVVVHLDGGAATTAADQAAGRLRQLDRQTMLAGEARRVVQVCDRRSRVPETVLRPTEHHQDPGALPRILDQLQRGVQLVGGEVPGALVERLRCGAPRPLDREPPGFGTREPVVGRGLRRPARRIGQLDQPVGDEPVQRRPPGRADARLDDLPGDLVGEGTPPGFPDLDEEAEVHQPLDDVHDPIVGQLDE